MIMGFLHKNRNPKTEVGTRNSGNSVIGITMFFVRRNMDLGIVD